MSDIVERLRGLADLFEAGDAPRHVVLHMRAGADEIKRLRAALERIASLDVPRPIGHTFRADGVASKHDKCWHGETMYDECAACLSNYARAALDYRKMEEGRT